jgi:hypothetical protein
MEIEAALWKIDEANRSYVLRRWGEAILMWINEKKMSKAESARDIAAFGRLHRGGKETSHHAARETSAASSGERIGGGEDNSPRVLRRMYLRIQGYGTS